jgi:hypothetical protein
VATLVLVAGCASSDRVVVDNEKGKYRDFREQFIAERPAEWGESRATCVADQMIPRLDPIVLSRMNAAARGDIQLTASEYDQISTMVKIRLQNDREEIKSACGA